MQSGNALHLFFFNLSRDRQEKTIVYRRETGTMVFLRFYSFLGRDVTLHMRFQSGVTRQMI